MQSTKELISADTIESAYTYDQYIDLVEKLLDENKTTGENHSEAMLHYTKMNTYRMKRHDKHIELSESLKKKLENLNRKLIWLVLTEGWCGDAAQNVPVINKMAEATPNITLRLILRDEHLEIMDDFLTDGKSRSIPKLICLDAETYEVLGTWGPRPQTAQQMSSEIRQLEGPSRKEAAERLHKWYADNKSYEIQEEFEELLDKWDD
ncbi:MAG: thioredoxin family protein [Balneolaceae bacterium]